MAEDTQQPESAGGVGSTRLLGILQTNRFLLNEALTNELDRLNKEHDAIKAKMQALWELRAEISRALF